MGSKPLGGLGGRPLGGGSAAVKKKKTVKTVAKEKIAATRLKNLEKARKVRTKKARAAKREMKKK